MGQNKSTLIVDSTTCLLCDTKVETSQLRAHISQDHFSEYGHVDLLVELLFNSCLAASKAGLSAVCHQLEKAIEQQPQQSPIDSSPGQISIKITSHRNHFKCAICVRVFDRRNALISHLTTHKTAKRAVNEKAIDQPPQLSPSKSSSGQSSSPKCASGSDAFKCAVCLGVFDGRNALISHLTTHKTAKRAVNIPQSYTHTSGLYKDEIRKDVDVNGKPIWLCRQCGKLTGSLNGAILHLSVHKSPRHSCSQCPKRFTQNSNMKRHLANVHQREMWVRTAYGKITRKSTKKDLINCLLCGDKVDQTELKSHISQLHFSQTDRSRNVNLNLLVDLIVTSCTAAAKVGVAKVCEQLEKAVKPSSNEPLVGTLLCPKCPWRKFTSRRTLKIHTLAKHKSENKTESQLPSTSAASSKLPIRSPKKTVPIPVKSEPSCSADVFEPYVGVYQKEMRKDVGKNGKMIWTCLHCHKTYDQWNNVVRHLVSHKPPKFTCPHCKKKIWFKGNLKRHLRDNCKAIKARRSKSGKTARR